MKITCSETWVSTSWIFTVPNFLSVNTMSCFRRKERRKGPVLLRASPPLRLFCCLQRGFFRFLWLGLCLLRGLCPAGQARPGSAVRRPCRPALPCANSPARRGDLCPFVSCDTQPVFVLKFIHDGYVSLPIAYAGSPAERADKLFSAAGPGWGRRAGGWRGPSAP